MIPEAPANWRDAPVKVGADCSFAQAGETHYGYLSGNAPLDVGNGRIGQRWLHDNGPCASGESLVVADCNTMEIVRISGQLDPKNPIVMSGGGEMTSVDHLYPPMGKIRLTTSTTVGDLIVTAEREDYDYVTNVMGYLAKLKPRNRFDPFCGCKLFYPDSVGAQG